MKAKVSEVVEDLKFKISVSCLSLAGRHQFCTQGDLTKNFPTFPNPIVNLDFHMKTDPGLSWVSNDW